MATDTIGDQGLDIVEHPTLGTLKFPKDMSFDDRNDAIDRLEKNAPYTEQGAASRPPVAPTLKVRSAFDLPKGLEGKEMLASPILPSGVGLVSVPRMIGSVAGSLGGSIGGKALAEKAGLSPTASQWAGDVAGFLGGGLGSELSDIGGDIKDTIGRTLRNPGKVTLGPGGDVADTITKGTLKPIPKAIASTAKLVGGPQIADALIPAHPEPIGVTSRLGKVGSKGLSSTLGGGAPDVNIIPEPRETLPGDRPGAMWSIKRSGALPAEAQRGTPGAGDVLRNIGKTVIYEPREGVGYEGRRDVLSVPNIRPGAADLGATPEAVATETKATILGRDNVSLPSTLAGEPREIMRQNYPPQTTSRATPGSELVPEEEANSINPSVKADIEKSVGRKLTDEEAIQYYRSQAESGMDIGRPGEDIGAIREVDRAKMEKKGRQ